MRTRNAETPAQPEDEEVAELADRSYWEQKSPESLGVVDAIKGLTPTTKGEPRITYNKHHIALRTSGYNFGWMHPRRAAFCHVELKVGAEVRPEIIKRLEKDEIEASSRGRSGIALRLSIKDVQEHRDALADVIRIAEELSHR